MLIGLFFYDVFWVFGSTPVFGSNVMVTVAKGVQAPIKLLFPRLMESMVENSTEVHFGSASIPVPASAGTEEAATLADLGPQARMLERDGVRLHGVEQSSSVCSFTVQSFESLALGENATFFVKDNVFMPSMLGGDIVVPGIFLALSERDVAAWRADQMGYFPSRSSSLSLSTTVAVMDFAAAARSSHCTRVLLSAGLPFGVVNFNYGLSSQPRMKRRKATMARRMKRTERVMLK